MKPTQSRNMKYTKLLEQIRALEKQVSKTLEACEGYDGLKHEKKELRHMLEILPSMNRPELTRHPLASLKIGFQNPQATSRW